MLRFYHSLWTAPMTRKKVRITMLCFASSFLLAKRLGAQVVLHTDQLGREMLKDIPYDEVYQDLNILSPKTKRFWAIGKLYATAREPLGAIHIDGDVFLKEPSLRNIFTNDYDMLVQNEDGNWRLDETYKITQHVLGQGLMQDGLHIDYPQAYNCGITQFINADLKNRYLKMYFDTIMHATNDPELDNRIKVALADTERRGSIIPDIVVEQQCLHEIATQMGAKVKEVLTGDIFKCSDEIGYCHLLSSNKYKQTAELHTLLKTLDKTLYKNITNNPVWKANG